MEDFDEKDRTLVSKLAYSINVFAEDVLNALDKNITIEDNIKQNKKDLIITVDATGRPTSKVTLNSGLGTTCVGIVVIRATNLTIPKNYASGTPFIDFSDNNGLLTINNVTNLTANNKYQLKLILQT